MSIQHRSWSTHGWAVLIMVAIGAVLALQDHSGNWMFQNLQAELAVFGVTCWLVISTVLVALWGRTQKRVISLDLLSIPLVLTVPFLLSGLARVTGHR
jgi:hypothetical protein